MTNDEIFEHIDARQTAEVVAALAANPALAAARDRHLGSTPLHFAVHRGLGEVVTALLSAGADVRARERVSGTTPLHWAAEAGHRAIARAIVERGADVEARDGWFDLTPLGWATVVDWAPQYRKDRAGTAAWLLEAGARLDAFTKVALGRVELLDAGDLGARLAFVGRAQGPLHVAVVLRRPEAVRRLVALGADLGARTSFGLTPLGLAAERGDGETAALLRQLGASDDPSVAVVTGAVPAVATSDEALLMAAAQTGNAAAIAALVGAGARPDAHVRHLLGETPAEVTALHIAAEHGHAAAARALLDAGAAPSPGAAEGLPTPLHLAAGGGHLETVRVLLAGGADATARDAAFGATARGWAESAGHAEVAALFST